MKKLLLIIALILPLLATAKESPLAKQTDKQRFESLATLIEVNASFAARCKKEVQIYDDWYDQKGCKKHQTTHSKLGAYIAWYSKPGIDKRFPLTANMLRLMDKSQQDAAFVAAYVSE